MLRVRSPWLEDSELALLESRHTAEDDIYDQVNIVRGVCSRNDLKPSLILNQVSSDPDMISTLYPGLPHQEALENLKARKDRCLVASLASTMTNKANILETGTFSGFTSAFALLGLGFSAGGMLLTIDLPTSNRVTQEHHIDYSGIGSILNKQKNRHRAIQVIEDAKSALPRILGENTVEMFVHDSLHTVTHQLYEYVVSRALMPINSILMSDDILWNKAFIGFVKLFDLPFWVCASNPNFGIAVNTCHKQEEGYDWGRQLATDYIQRYASR